MLEFILERVTNISMGTEIDNINEFEDVLCLDPNLTLESGWVSMRGEGKVSASDNGGTKAA